jgi:hypothetical protein
MVSISIAMATYNGARFLREQLESLATQIHLPVELQVGDDGSCDETLTILDEFKSRAPFPVVVHRNPSRLGITENFLATAGRCTGDWIAFCDQDDVWLPEKLSRCAMGIEQGPTDLMLVAHSFTIVFEGETRTYLNTDRQGAEYRPRLGLLPHWCCAGFSQIFRRDLLTIVTCSAGRDLRHMSMRHGHDVWIPTLAAATGSTLLLGEPLALYRRHGENSTPIIEHEPRTLQRKLWRALRANGRAYAEEASVSSRVAVLLENISAAAMDERAQVLLADAAVHLYNFSKRNFERSRIYSEKSPFRRLTIIKDLLHSGAYGGSRSSAFGRWAFLKDLAYALFGVFS